MHSFFSVSIWYAFENMIATMNENAEQSKVMWSLKI